MMFPLTCGGQDGSGWPRVCRPHPTVRPVESWLHTADGDRTYSREFKGCMRTAAHRSWDALADTRWPARVEPCKTLRRSRRPAIPSVEQLRPLWLPAHTLWLGHAIERTRRAELLRCDGRAGADLLEQLCLFGLKLDEQPKDVEHVD